MLDYFCPNHMDVVINKLYLESELFLSLTKTNYILTTQPIPRTSTTRISTNMDKKKLENN